MCRAHYSTCIAHSSASLYARAQIRSIQNQPVRHIPKTGHKASSYTAVALCVRHTVTSNNVHFELHFTCRSIKVKAVSSEKF